MPFAALPLELVIEILSFAVDDPRRFIEHVEFDTRLRELCAFARVHRTWTRPAQLLLVKRRLQSDHVPHFVDLDAALAREPFREFVVHEFDYDADDLAKLPPVRHSQSLYEVSTLRLQCAELCSEYLEQFTRLVTLDVFVVRTFRLDVAFPLASLRRLVIGGHTTFGGAVETWTSFFSSTNLPSLAHLAIDVDEQVPRLSIVLGGILPQLVTLALSHRTAPIHPRYLAAPDESLFAVLPTLPRLRHLSLDMFAPGVLDDFCTQSRGLRLESLHVPDSFVSFVSGMLVPVALDDLARRFDRDDGFVVAERVIVYRGQDGIDHGFGLEEGRIRSAKRSGPPPFSSFTGVEE
ncbi:hypothetical protein JCM10212_000540 [Sporobolomyces blumeae]